MIEGFNGYWFVFFCFFSLWYNISYLHIDDMLAECAIWGRVLCRFFLIFICHVPMLVYIFFVLFLFSVS